MPLRPDHYNIFFDKIKSLVIKNHPDGMRIYGAGGRIRTFEGVCRQIYSLMCLTTSLPQRIHGAGCQARTDDLRFTKPLLYQLS